MEGTIGSQDEHEPVLLRNGARVVPQLVVLTMKHVRELWDTHDRAVFELLALCRDDEHKPFGSLAYKLAGRGLIEKRGIRWVAHDTTRDIVLSACEGDDLGLKIVNPVA